MVAGEMLELGPEGEALHARVWAADGGARRGCGVGVRGLAAALVDGAAEAGAEVMFVATPEQAGEW